MIHARLLVCGVGEVGFLPTSLTISTWDCDAMDNQPVCSRNGWLCSCFAAQAGASRFRAWLAEARQVHVYFVRASVCCFGRRNGIAVVVDLIAGTQGR